MQEDIVFSLIIQALRIALVLSIVPLAAIFISGFIISIIQSVTQIQESVIAFVPKFLSLTLVFYLAGGWMMEEVLMFFTDLLMLVGTV